MLSKDEYRHLLSQIPRSSGIDPLIKRNSISIDPLQQQTSPSMTNSVEMHSPTGMPTSSLMTPQVQTQQLPSVLPSSPDYSLTGINIPPERFKNYTELGCYNNQTDAIMQSPPSGKRPSQRHTIRDGKTVCHLRGFLNLCLNFDFDILVN